MNQTSPAHTAPGGAAFSRRAFLRSTTAMAALAAIGRPTRSLIADLAPAPAPKSESIVKLLFESLKPEQKSEICFPWDHIDPKRGLLRTRIQNNWRITKPIVKSDFYTADQQAMIRAIFEGITTPEWHARFDKQLMDDIGRFGQRQASSEFREPAHR